MLQKEIEVLKNVFFIDAVTKTQMPAILGSVNAAIIPLRKLDLFLGAIPSKIFETLAMKVPILLGVDGEAKKLFIEQGNCGIFFEPENNKQLAEAVLNLFQNNALGKQLGENGRRFVEQHFNRENIAARFYEQLINL
jgi:glycosyltransferase involved in cell wall biosynthesis